MDKKNSAKNSTDLAGRIYETSDYQKNDVIATGLSTTHEQASDSYMEGTIDPTTDDDLNAKDLPIAQKPTEMNRKA
ncbi:YozQ family protein [Neobacillus vireti]|uniref:YozQ family protein n=1 Tax=Neobacillus vireti TaxID=220686 RepID=UPI003000520E